MSEDFCLRFYFGGEVAGIFQIHVVGEYYVRVTDEVALRR
jgi:hypothetical protein